MKNKCSKVSVLLVICCCLVLSVPGLAQAEWQVLFDAEAVRVLHLTNNPLGNFATSSECQTYWESRSQFEKDHSKCIGFDTATAPVSGESDSESNSTCARAQKSSGDSCCLDSKGEIKGHCPPGYPVFKDVRTDICPNGRCFKYGDDCMKAGWGFCYTCSVCQESSSNNSGRGRRR